MSNVVRTAEEIDAMRAKLAKKWGQSIDQVTEAEARYYLRWEGKGHDCGPNCAVHGRLEP